MNTEEKHKQKILDDLHEMLRAGYCEDSIGSVIEIDIEKKTITIEFKYNVVPDDDYIGLSHY